MELKSGAENKLREVVTQELVNDLIESRKKCALCRGL